MGGRKNMARKKINNGELSYYKKSQSPKIKY